VASDFAVDDNVISARIVVTPTSHIAVNGTPLSNSNDVNGTAVVGVGAHCDADVLSGNTASTARENAAA
jgi:hypothetical protein